MILDSHKLIYIHPPRTGGTTIKHMFGYRGSDVPHAKYHDTGEIIKTRAPEKWDAYLKIATIRNPWDRVSSIFRLYHSKPHGGYTIPDTFEEFLDIKWYKRDFTVLGPCYNFIGYKVDHIIRYENYREEQLKLIRKFNLDISAAKIHARPSPSRGHYSTMYTSQKYIDQVADDYLPDIENYGYIFERVDP